MRRLFIIFAALAVSGSGSGHRPRRRLNRRAPVYRGCTRQPSHVRDPRRRRLLGSTPRVGPKCSLARWPSPCKPPPASEVSCARNEPDSSVRAVSGPCLVYANVYRCVSWIFAIIHVFGTKGAGGQQDWNPSHPLETSRTYYVWPGLLAAVAWLSHRWMFGPVWLEQGHPDRASDSHHRPVTVLHSIFRVPIGYLMSGKRRNMVPPNTFRYIACCPVSVDLGVVAIELAA
jgi:hypothetical protein